MGHGPARRRGRRQDLGFPAWLRIQHFLNFLFMGLLIRSGIEILSSHPRLYWNNHCLPGSDWLTFTKRKVPPEEGAYMARDDELVVSPWISLPGTKKIGLGRRWHGVTNTLWMLNGLIYVVLLFGTGQWRRLVPTSWEVFPDAWDSLKTYLSLDVPPVENLQPYDALQQLMYAFIVFVVGPLMIVTGPAMSPAVVGRFPWYAKMLGGRQAARSLHFIGMAIDAVFVVFHVALVFVVHPEHNVTPMIYGPYRSDRVGTAAVIMVIGALLVVAFWLWASFWSARKPRQDLKVLDALEEPIRAATINHIKSAQRGHYTEKDISPYQWSNGRHPTPEESPEWEELRQRNWEGYALELGGLVEREASVSLDQLRAMTRQDQITMHTCMQGWTGIAKWSRVRLSDVLALVEPLPNARYLKVISYGKAQSMYGEGRELETFYTCLLKELVYEEETILAYEMNDQPLPLTFGAPLRMRIESIHGYKMLKYLRRLEWIEDYRTQGDGSGGRREDSAFLAMNGRI